MTGNPKASYESADALRKQGKFAAACEQFAQLWQHSPGLLIGWRYAYCLRKLGRLDEAEAVAKSALAQYPEDTYARSELAWILYEKYLKPAKAENNLAGVISAAEQVLALDSGAMVRAKAVLAVMSLAKTRGDWRLLLEWSDRVSPEDLSNQPMQFGGKTGMSEREIWYIRRADALIECRRFVEARQCAQAGLREFPNQVFLRRSAAVALARSGDLAGGISEMRALQARGQAEWYMKAELAEMEHQAGNHRVAYRLICEALLTCRQSDEYKLNHLATAAHIALALDRLDVAAGHVALAKAIRMGNRWKIPSDLLDLERHIRARLKGCGQAWPVLPEDARQLGALCRRQWHEGSCEGLEFFRGTVAAYPEGRSFTYIRRDDTGEDVFALVKDLPVACRRPGSRVEFAIQASYDRKKARESVRAVSIRCAEGAG